MKTTHKERNMFSRGLKNTDNWYQRTALSLARGHLAFSVKPTQTIEEAVEVLEGDKDIDSLLVTENGKINQRLLGIINDRDIHKAFSKQSPESGSLTVEQIMLPFDPSGTRYPYLTAEDKIIKALELFKTPLFQPFNNVSYVITCLPIVESKDYKLLGLLTPSDLITAMDKGEIPVPDRSIINSMVANSPSQELPYFIPEDNINDISAFMRSTGHPTIPVLQSRDNYRMLGVVVESKVVECIHTLTIDERENIKATDPRVMIDFKDCLVINQGGRLKEVVKMLATRPRTGMIIVVSDEITRNFEGFLGRSRIFQIILQEFQKTMS